MREPAPRHPKTHDLVGRHNIVTEHPYDRDYARVRVQHWVDDLRSGDKVWWCPKLTVDSLRLYQVIGTWPHSARRGVWMAELGRLDSRNGLPSPIPGLPDAGGPAGYDRAVFV